TGIAAGVLYHDGWVYATIAPDLWRFKDTDDDGVADIREIVVHGIGHHLAYAGHDMHGPMVGPDGRIYWSMGDKGINVVSKEGRRFFYPNEGVTMRVEPDGSGFEVYTHGNRNVQEPAFNEFGDLIGVDNDADQPGERERFVFLAEASDSGWRNCYQYMRMDSPWMREGLWKPHFAGQAAYILPPLLSYSDGPAGFKHDPGTALGEAQRGMFILNEFPSGKMRAFRTEQDGATFKMVDARILNDGIMGIGLSWQPDGSLMMADWIGGYPLDGLGALWRVDVKDAAKSPLRAETKKIIVAGFAGRADGELAALLGHADQRVRQGAQLELAKRGKGAALLKVANNPKAAQLARIHALWGVGQLLRRNATEAGPVVALLRDTDAEIRAQAAKVLGDGAEKDAKDEGAALIGLLTDAAPRVRLQAGIALAKFREPKAVDALFAFAERDATVPILRHAAATGLTGCATAAQLAAKKNHPAVHVRLVAVVALRRQGAPEVAEFLADSDPLVVGEAARAIHDESSISAALPALASLVGRPLTSEPVLRRAINAGLRLGTAEAAGRLINYSLDEKAPRAMREEALVSLRSWKNPPRLDRVDGWARTFQPAAIAAVLNPELDRLLALADPGLKTLAVEIMIAHSLKVGAGQIVSIVGDAKASGELRAQALRLMAGGERANPDLAPVLDLALAANAPASLHQAALEQLLPAQAERLAREARGVLQTRTVAEKQHVTALLAQAASPAADAILVEQGEAIVAGKGEAALTLDVLEALRARAAASPAVTAVNKAYAELPTAAALTELLAGGDIGRGRDIVANHLAANCTACHSVENSGGSAVGPNLRLIGAQHDPAYILESLLLPSAKIAVGFGLVNVTRKDKTEVTGTLAKETPQAVTVRLFDGA
ncbi:MAG: HEAT repeat domain-containing protein, partial [Opitutaceae bacterium]